jgi:YVTN family beta-propeller protein
VSTTRRALAALLLLAACKGDEHTVSVYAPYAGEPAYPNRRTPIAYPEGEVGFTSDNGSDTVSVVDLAGGDVIATVPVGRSPIDRDGPHHLAIDPEGGFLYVALAYPPLTFLPGPHSVHGSSVRSGWVQKLALDDLRVLGEVRVDNNPGDVVISADMRRVVVSHYDLQRVFEYPGDLDKQRSTLVVLDPDDVLLEGSAEPKRISTCVAGHGVALDAPAGKLAYVACFGEDSIAVVDTDSGDVERVLVGDGGGVIGTPTYGPYSAVLSPGGDRLAIGNLESRDLRFLALPSRELEALTVDTGGAPYFPAWSADGARLYVPTQGPDAIVVVDAATGDELDTRAFDDESCILPHEVVLSRDEASLYVVCEGDKESPGSVLVLDAATLGTESTTAVGVYPDRLVTGLLTGLVTGEGE